MGIRVEVDLLEIIVANAIERLFACTRPSSRGAEEPDNRCALGAAEAGIAFRQLRRLQSAPANSPVQQLQ